MSLKIKLISSIMAFCMILSLLLVGVFSLPHTYFDINGSISFEANGAKAHISKGKLSKNAFDPTLNGGKTEEDIFKEFTINTTSAEKENGLDDKIASWKGVNLIFPDGNDVILTFTVTNKNKIEQLVVWPECITDTTNSNVCIDIKGDENVNNVLAKASGTGAVAEGSKEEYTITFSLIDKKKSADFKFSINVVLTTASELPESGTYKDFGFVEIGTEKPNCLSVKQASDTVSGNIEFPEFVQMNSLAYKVSEIGDEGFRSNTNITGVTISKTITSIGNDAFNGCEKITSIILGENVKSIGTQAFGATSITELTIPENITNLGFGILYYCTTIKKIFYNAVNAEGSQAFMYSGASENEMKMVIGESVRNTDKVLQAYSGVGPQIIELTINSDDLTMDASYPNIGVLGNWFSLRTIIINSSNPPKLLAKLGSGLNALQHIYVPSGAVETFKNADYWSEHAGIIEANPN